MADDNEDLLGAGGSDAELDGGPSGLDPVAAAAALDAARRDPALNKKLGSYLEEQQALARLQIKHFDEEHRLAIEAARRRRYADRIRNGLITLAALLVISVIAIAGFAVRDAMNDHGLVIEPFSVPPEIAQSGLTGQVVAQRFLDRLNAMQNATLSERPAQSYEYNWGDAIRVEIPETGISLTELQNLLREKLGHITHITGEVVRTPDGGIAITARWGNAPPQTFSGKLADFDNLAQQSAEAVYRASQPFRFAEYLYQRGRVDEAAHEFAEVARQGPAVETGWALTRLGYLAFNEHGDVRSARMHLERGSALGNIMADVGLINVELWSGHDEKVLDTSKLVDRLAETRAPDTTESFFEENRAISDGYLAGQVGDFTKSAANLSRPVTATVDFTDSDAEAAAVANADALDHDSHAAWAAIAQQAPVNDIGFLQADADQGWLSLPVYWIAVTRGDWHAALADAAACDDWLKAHTAKHGVYGFMRPVLVVPLEALALAHTGDVARAEALIATTPADCYLCARVRGQIAATKKDWTAAAHWFAEAIRLGPSIPFAYSEWGAALLAKGDATAAMAQFKQANAKGPHFADPLELWGEALMLQNRSDLALAKFEDADRYAPRWGHLHVMWGEALYYAGRKDAARKEFAAAAGLELSQADRAALAAYLD